ncbi:hypothetical protein [Ligilactobacillus ruminis]|uniref:hypothetical protein n=1 Tax=Ligilactobacillus ruminis TaxID=1623 RepID=UPI0006EEE0B1|nr:hypothetical protein [Ligilactobacillus ruminis]KRM82032.1 hypothetical protein FC25_GL001336 [Ligilactobacillus ruminis DSM 20403 = NBRC 102161]
MPNKYCRLLAGLSGIFLVLMHETLFEKCSASHRSINAPKRKYGQNNDFWNLPVKSSHPLRAKWRFLGFARKIQSPVTGKTAISGICP